MRREVELSTACSEVTDTAASVVEHLASRAALLALDRSEHATRLLERVGVRKFWGAVRLVSFDLCDAFRIVERERARVAVRANPNYFHPDRGTDLASITDAALDARRLLEELWTLELGAFAPMARVARMYSGIEPHERIEPTEREIMWPEWPICPVCLCDSVDPVRLTCAHIFCKACIDAWFCAAATCPVCRAEATERCTLCGVSVPGRVVWAFPSSRAASYCAMCAPC
jgi:hypothetical protein